MIRFLTWHYTIFLIKVLKAFFNFQYFLFHYFSIPYLSTTLISPWKRQVFKYDSPGLHPDKIAEVIVLNLISRTVGLTVRLITVTGWLLSTLSFSLAYFLMTFIFFICPIITIPIYLSWKRNRDCSVKNIINKYGSKSETLFNKLFLNGLSVFIFDRLEINTSDYSYLFNSKNSPEDEEQFQLGLKSSEANLPGLAKLFSEKFTPLVNFLDKNNIPKDDFLELVTWYEKKKTEEEKNKKFWELESLQKIKCIGKDWAYGYTINLDKFSQDLNDAALKSPKMIGRKNEIESMERILSKVGENNILLVGEAGVGRKTLIYGLAQKIADGQTTPSLSHKRILMFDINSALADANTIEAKRAKLSEIFNEAKLAGNIILAIADFDKYVSTGNERINFTDVFSQNIGNSNLLIIGITTPDQYHRYILPESAIQKLFETVEVLPPTKKEAITILENLTATFERKYRCLVTYHAIKEIVTRADMLITDVPFPEKAINLLDEAVYFATHNLKTKTVNKEVIDKLLFEKTKIPLAELTESEKDKLLNLEEYLHQRIVDQEEAVSDISKAMKRGRLRIGLTNKPIGSFLFLGPTGVGKTETAKALANLYFGSEDKLLRFDMSEFIGSTAIEKLIGTTEGKPGLLTTAVKDNPFAVLLLDEFEKTTSETINLFLSVFDEGYLKDAQGKIVSFTNLIIIATSNAAAEFIREKVESKTPSDILSKDLLDYLLSERIFSPELMNRFDSVIFFKPLEYSHLKEIAKMMLANLNKNLKEEHNITIKITDELVHKIATLGYSPTFGARPMKRLIQDKVETPLAQMLLEEKVKKGEEVEIYL